MTVSDWLGVLAPEAPLCAGGNGGPEADLISSPSPAVWGDSAAACRGWKATVVPSDRSGGEKAPGPLWSEPGTLLEHVPVAVLGIDEDDRICYWGPGAQDLFGYAPRGGAVQTRRRPLPRSAPGRP